MTSIGKTPPDTLQITGSTIRKQPVEPVAAYGGNLDAKSFDEFDRRYGIGDYVII